MNTVEWGRYVVRVETRQECERRGVTRCSEGIAELLTTKKGTYDSYAQQ